MSTGEPTVQNATPALPWKPTAWVAAIACVIYLIGLTPLWTPGGDSEFFVAAARSLVRGEGYVFNGGPVRIAPPGWPLLLAGVFKLSPTFLAGKIVNIVCLVGAWTLSHRVLLRLMEPRWATLAVMLAATLHVSYSLTFWLHSDPLFCLLAWAAALAAVRLTEDFSRVGSWAVFCITLALLPTVRDAALLQVGIVLGLLWRGYATRPRPAVLAAIAAVAITLLAHSATAALTAHWAEAVGPGEYIATPALAENEAVDLLDNGPNQRPPFVIDRSLRIVQVGHWPAWALWYPLRFAGAFALAAWIPLLIGTVVLAAVASAKSRDGSRMIWIATAGYVLLLAFLWPLPNARYLVPIAPLVIGGVFVGLEHLQPAWTTRMRWLMVASLVAINGPMFVIDAAVQHRSDYYATYEGGQLASLVAATEYLNAQAPDDRTVAISERYDNLGAMRFMKTGSRRAILLLDRELVIVPDVYSFPPGEIPAKSFEDELVLPGGFREWAEKKEFDWYLYQEPVRPWRLWHFEVPDAVMRLVDKESAGERTIGWRLWTSQDGFVRPVELPPAEPRITRVPGL